MRQYLEIEILERIVTQLERLNGAAPQNSELRELRDRLIALKVVRQLDREARPTLDWAKLVPLGMLLAVLLAAIVAALLGVDVRNL